MKYMGSKQTMLQNGLGTLLNRRLRNASRFVDLFSGSTAVACYVARRKNIRVRAVDLQSYSAALARGVLRRREPFCWKPSWTAWLKRATAIRCRYRPPHPKKLTHKAVKRMRGYCSRSSQPLTRSYGGHYFSAYQSLWLDAFRATLPCAEPARSIALAALIRAASQCAASPGHTAQPLQPTRTAKKFLAEAWKRDVVTKTKAQFESISSTYARRCGTAAVQNANKAAKSLRKGDVAFIDPPYSGVHYSRFYHVLEAVALGEVGEVSGVGRYPDSKKRPWSRYSVATEARTALAELFETVASRQVRSIVTFPVHKCSNGLSGRIVRNIARQYFYVADQKVESRFSSLGGIGAAGAGAARREARIGTKELILILKPKRRSR